MLAKIKSGNETFIVTCDAPFDAAAGNMPLRAKTYPTKIDKNLIFEFINDHIHKTNAWCDIRFNERHYARKDQKACRRHGVVISVV